MREWCRLTKPPVAAENMRDNWLDREQLHFAAADGDAVRIVELIAAGHDPNAFDDLGMTPLHHAARAESLRAVQQLLSAGANVNARDESRIGNTPLGEVAATCSLAMAQALVEAGADPTIPGWMQLTALHKASRRKRETGREVYELLHATVAGERPGW